VSLPPLVLRFDPHTVDHLGAKMYSHLPNAIAELVANAYDADATTVRVELETDESIRVIDNGHGMSRADVSEKYLRIGRNRRLDGDSTVTESGRRQVSGKKGLGKLALFGIGKTVRLETTRQGSADLTHVLLSYDDMMSTEGDYHPKETTTSIGKETHGTSVTLSDLKRKSPIDAAELASSLARLFNYTDADFELVVVGSDGAEHFVTADRRLASVEQEFSWVFPDSFIPADELLSRNHVAGRVVSAKKPLRQGLRGITLYAHGRLVNEPEFFGASESSYAYSYLSGYLEVDFIDQVQHDVIATDRRALDWESEETSSLRSALAQLVTRIGQEWRELRRGARAEATEVALGTSTDEWIESVQSPEQEPLKELVESITSEDLEIDVDQQVQLLEEVRRIAPPNAEYAWRHLHSEIQDATKSYYVAGDYWTAVQEAIKRYVGLTATKAGLSADNAINVVTSAFGASGKLKVLNRLETDPAFTQTTMKDIQDGQKHLSMGVVAGFRNPLAHTELESLRTTEALSYQDCLDALGIVSHLTRRLDESKPSV